VPPIPPQIEEVPEDETPQAAPVVPAAPLPQTGELPPYFAYGFGALLVLAGLFLKRKY
jgi:LPXTG-motif cell wall-anchored protein